jgi:hypothetical protein
MLATKALLRQCSGAALALAAAHTATDTAGGSIEQGGVPLFGAGRYPAFKEIHEGQERAAGIA